MNPLTNKRVLITGGTGSLGTAVLSRAKRENWNTEFVILSRGETKQSQVRSKYPEHTYVLGDVSKLRDLQRVISGVDVVLHFAAYKQVPSAQNNVPATVETNVIGSQNVVDAAIQAGVEKVVASSTDKSTSPANCYGASKYLMETIFQNANNYSNNTTFHLARYGNVISSNASVIPLFQRQAASGGPLTVTSKEMTRFWITLDDAIDLILLALEIDPGTIVVPKAKAFSIFELAKLIGPECSIIETGVRPGEKIHEAMVSPSESFHTNEFEDHFEIRPPYAGTFNDSSFEYTSDKAVQLKPEEMQAMIDYTDDIYGDITG